MNTLQFILLIIFSCLFATYSNGHKDFVQCLSKQFQNYSSISNLVYTPNDSSYSSILRFSIHNSRFAKKSTPKPLVIVTPDRESQIPPVIYCAKKNDLQIRTRSGGHDFEGLSYVSKVPFLIIDLIKLSEITVDVEEKTAWVGAGAIIGALYYKIAEKSSTLGFPAGFCPSVGVGGHFSGGGYGLIMRKYGLSADNVVDARIIIADGQILDRKSMGENLFWAIRGGGGSSFGVIVAWKVHLVNVPETVTVFRIQRTLEQNVIQLIHRWQYVAPRLDHDLFIGITVRRVNSTIRASFFSLFLGGIDRLLPLMQNRFPELGLVREDCTEMSWIQSVLYIAGLPINSTDTLLNRMQPDLLDFKVKLDYVQKPVPRYVFDGIVRQYYEQEAKESEIFMIPYGGRMDEIPESAIPFPHRAGNLYHIANMVFWQNKESQDSARYIRWARRLYNYMTPFVSEFPRAAYLNYRDLDIGVNKDKGETSYAQASVWGMKYFKNNFNRLVRVKTIVDPKNFFRNEQSIPPIYSKWTEK